MLLIVSTNHVVQVIKLLLFFACITIHKSFFVVVDCYVTNVGVVLSPKTIATNEYHMSLLKSSLSLSLSLSSQSNHNIQPLFAVHVKKIISSSRNRFALLKRTKILYLMSSLSSNQNNKNDIKPKRKYTTKNGKIVSSEGTTRNLQSTSTSSSTMKNTKINSINKSSGSDNSSSSSKHKIAIIGGGIAGLRCAQRLVQQEKEQETQNNNNIDVTVFDTGRLRPGGRCSSRFPNDPLSESSSSSTSSSSSSSILSKYRYDHAAQVINVQVRNNNKNNNNLDQTNDEYDDFIKQIKEWQIQDVVRPFPKNAIYTIDSISTSSTTATTTRLQLYDSSNNNNEDDDTTSSSVLYYSPNGMSSIGLNIVQKSSFQLQQDVWVSPSNGIRFIKNHSNNNNNNNNNKWQVQSIVNGKKYIWGYYDTLFIAHNGKCADRLLSTIPDISNTIHPLMRVNFASTIFSTTNKMTLNSIYSLSFAISKAENKLLFDSLPTTFCFGYVNNNPILKSITCQTQKLSNNNDGNNNDKDKNDSDELQVWTILSTPDFATAYKGPQENLPIDIVNEVTKIMLLAFEDLHVTLSSSAASAASNNNAHPKSQIHTSERTRTTTTSTSSSKNGGGTTLRDKSISIKKDIFSTNRKTTLQILDSKLQLWGAAVPLNVWTIPTTEATSTSTTTTTTTTTSSSQDETNKSKNNNKLLFKPAGYLYDSTNRIGVCGDWLYEPSIAGAWISGNLLAQHILYNNTTNHGGVFDSTTSSSSSKTKTGTTITTNADESRVGTATSTITSSSDVRTASSQDKKQQLPVVVKNGKFQTSSRVAQVGIGAT